MTPAHHFLSQSGTSSTFTTPTPITRQPLLLVSALRSACLCLPPCPASVIPPFTALVLRPGPCHPLGGYPVMGPSVFLVSVSLHEYSIVNLVYLDNTGIYHKLYYKKQVPYIITEAFTNSTIIVQKGQVNKRIIIRLLEPHLILKCNWYPLGTLTI